LFLIYGCNSENSIEGESKNIEPYKFQFADLWFTKDQQGQRLYDSGDFLQAAQKYEELMWRGISYYRAGEFDKAKSVFALINSPQGYYNLGMSYAETGNLLAAREAFIQALVLYPGYEEAKKNLDEIESLIPKKKEIQLQEIYDTESEQQKQSQELDQKEDKKGDEEQQDGKGEKAEPDESSIAQQQDKEEMMFFDKDIPLTKEKAKDIVLRQMSSDPAVFLKRKFSYQFYKMKDKPKPPEKTW
jgi:Ca-activated chloride channel family protein